MASNAKNGKIPAVNCGQSSSLLSWDDRRRLRTTSLLQSFHKASCQDLYCICQPKSASFLPHSSFFWVRTQMFGLLLLQMQACLHDRSWKKSVTGQWADIYPYFRESNGAKWLHTVRNFLECRFTFTKFQLLSNLGPILVVYVPTHEDWKSSFFPEDKILPDAREGT